jgi:hypothetical protein
MKQYIEDTCEILCESNGRKMVADGLDFKDRQYLSVSVDKKVKVQLQWNGKFYEGGVAGLNFSTDGPTVSTYRQGR